MLTTILYITISHKTHIQHVTIPCDIYITHSAVGDEKNDDIITIKNEVLAL